MIDTQTVLFLVAMIGCFVGLAGWLKGRETKTANDSEWRGEVNGKLNAILGINTQVDKLQDEVKLQGRKLAVVEERVKNAHTRIDEVEGKK